MVEVGESGQVAGEVDSERRTRERLAICGSLSRSPQEIGDLEIIRGADPDLEIGALYELSLRHDLSAGAAVREHQGLRSALSRADQCARVARADLEPRHGSGARAAQGQPPGAHARSARLRQHRAGDRERASTGDQVDVQKFPGAALARGRRRQLHRHRVHRHHQGPRQRLGQCRHLSRPGAGHEDARASSSSRASTATSSAANTGRAASPARW